jgi:hypothetical protein
MPGLLNATFDSAFMNMGTMQSFENAPVVSPLIYASLMGKFSDLIQNIAFIIMIF